MFGFLKQRNERWIKARLSLYLDGRLSLGDEAKVESHLKDCQACRDEFASLKATVEALRQLPLVSPPRFFMIPVLKPSPRPVAFYRLRMATVAVSVLLVAVIAGDSLSVFFKPEAPQSLMTPAPAAMPAPRLPTAAIAPALTATPTAIPAPATQPTPAPRFAPTPVPAPAPQSAEAAPISTAAVTPAPTLAMAPQDVSGAAGMAGPSIVITPTPSVAPFQAPQAPVPAPAPTPVLAPAGKAGAPGKAGISAVPVPTPSEPPTVPQKALPVGPKSLAAESLAEATPTPQLSPALVEQYKAEIAQPTPETPTPSQAPPQAPDYLWPVRQFEIALVALILILISATTYFWLRGKKE